MDYEKKYNEALERAKDFRNGEVHYALHPGESIVCYIFPELRESEDEQTRKDLRDFILNRAGYLLDENTEHRFIAYLEKQKEKVAFLENETPKSLSDEFAEIERDDHEAEVKQDYSGLTDLERAIHRGFLCAGVENVPVGIIKETAQECLAQMKPAGWEKATIDHLYTLASFIKSTGYEDDGEFLEGVANKLKTIHDRPATEWSEEDESMRKDVVSILELYRKEFSPSKLGVDMRIGRMISWINSIHAPKRENWDEADAQTIGELKQSIWQINQISDNRKKWYSLWLDRHCNAYPIPYNLLPKWKPSEEQMKALIDCTIGNEYDVHALVRLWAELKKL